MKATRKAGAATTMAAVANTTTPPVEGLDCPEEYRKLYKQLGTKNNNKDVRMQLQSRLDSSIEAPMSPNLQLNINAGYHMDNGMAITTNRMTHTGEKVEETDKVYFRKRDEVSNYAEFMFKAKILINKK